MAIIRDVKYAIQNSKFVKALESDEMPSELLKLIAENTIEILLEFYNTICATGRINIDYMLHMLQMHVWNITKENNERECSKFYEIFIEDILEDYTQYLAK